MENIELEIRRGIVSTPVGSTKSIHIGSMDYEVAMQVARRFSKIKGLPMVIVESQPGTIAIKRVTADQARVRKFSEIDALEIGQSHLFKLPRPMHQGVRMAASIRNRRGDTFYSCNAEDDGIRVVRYPLTTDAEQPQMPSRKVTKYGLEKLDSCRMMVFVIDKKDQHKLRMAVSQKARTEGWVLRCRLQDDGTMLVYRTDSEASGPADGLLVDSASTQ